MFAFLKGNQQYYELCCCLGGAQGQGLLHYSQLNLPRDACMHAGEYLARSLHGHGNKAAGLSLEL